MPKYRKKPVVVDAEQYEPGMEDGFWCEINDHIAEEENKHYCAHFKPYINTLEGRHCISSGDWIITHKDGRKEVLIAAEFEKEYERVEKPDGSL